MNQCIVLPGSDALNLNAAEFRSFAKHLSGLVDAESYFFLSCTYGVYTNPELLLNLKFGKKLIIFFMADNPGRQGGGDYNWYQYEKNYTLGIIEQVAKNNPDKTFLLCHELYNISELLTEPNLHDCNVFTVALYDPNLINYNPVFEKKSLANKTFLSLNNSASIPRVFLVSLLFGNYLDQFGITTLGDDFKSYSKLDSILDIVDWDFNLSENQIELYNTGFKKMNLGLNTEKAQVQIHNMNGNFVKLQHKFEQTFVSIVTESIITDEFVCPTEKYFYTVIGCNFPLIYSTKNFIKTVKELGFDVFEDIVDHSYDTISNPIDRLEKLIESNKSLLSDISHTKSLWNKNRQRFLDNYYFFTSNFCKNFKINAEQRFLKKIANIKDNS